MRQRPSHVSLVTLVLSLFVATVAGRARADAAAESATGLAAPATSAAAPTESSVAPDERPAHLEVSFGLGPTLSLGGLAGLSGDTLAGLGGVLGFLRPRIDLAFVVAPTVLVSVGMNAAYTDALGPSWISLGGELGALFYGEPPRPGQVTSHTRVFLRGSGAGAVDAASAGALGGGMVSLALGGALGFTWFPIRSFGVRLEGTATASGSSSLQYGGVTLALEVGAGAALVARL